jgi:hypothetical protein
MNRGKRRGPCPGRRLPFRDSLEGSDGPFRRRFARRFDPRDLPVQLELPFADGGAPMLRTPPSRPRSFFAKRVQRYIAGWLFPPPRRGTPLSTATPSTTPLQRVLTPRPKPRKGLMTVWHGTSELLGLRPTLSVEIFSDSERELLLPPDSIWLLLRQTGQRWWSL